MLCNCTIRFSMHSIPPPEELLQSYTGFDGHFADLKSLAVALWEAQNTLWSLTDGSILVEHSTQLVHAYTAMFIMVNNY